MWWSEIAALPQVLSQVQRSIHPSAEIADGAVVLGAVRIGARTRVCSGARIEGPVVIGADCMIGNNALVRAHTVLGDRCRIGFAVEMKQAILAEDVSIGPQCYVADSVLAEGVYLGAQVRTSNHRLDRQQVQVMRDGQRTDTGLDKLGCHIGARASLGIQCIVLPGREVAAGTVLGPRITVVRNLPSGRYVLRQDIERF